MSPTFVAHAVSMNTQTVTSDPEFAHLISKTPLTENERPRLTERAPWLLPLSLRRPSSLVLLRSPLAAHFTAPSVGSVDAPPALFSSTPRGRIMRPPVVLCDELTGGRTIAGAAPTPCDGACMIVDPGRGDCIGAGACVIGEGNGAVCWIADGGVAGQRT